MTRYVVTFLLPLTLIMDLPYFGAVWRVRNLIWVHRSGHIIDLFIMVWTGSPQPVFLVTLEKYRDSPLSQAYSREWPLPFTRALKRPFANSI